jgi:P2-related tail formation protein
MLYATKSIWLTSSNAPASNYLLGLDAHFSLPTSQNPINSSTSWTVAKNASASYASITASSAATNWSTVVKPDGTLSSTIGEGWVFGPYSGVFSQNTFSLQINVIATTVSSQAGKIQYRLWKASDVSGSNSSLITPTIQSTQTAAVIAGGALIFSSSFIMTSSVTFNNEYFFIEAAWAVTTAGGSNSSNVIFRAGSASFFTTGQFEDNTFIMLSDDNAPGLT